MKNLKLVFGLFVLSLLATATLSAQTSDKANKIIEDSKKKFDGLKSITAKFSYTLSNPNLEEEIVKKGDVMLQKGNKYRIFLGDEEFRCDGKTVWVIMHADEEITITDFDPEESMSVEGIYKVYNEKTRSKYEGEEGGAHRVTLFMQDEESDAWKVEMWINKSSKLVDKAKMYGRNGTTYTYVLASVKENVEIPASKLTCNPGTEFPDYYENDLR